MEKERSIFVDFFGDHPTIRVFDFLITHQMEGSDYSKKHIAKYSDVSWNTLETFWSRLEKNGLVVRTRKVGKAQMYKLNTSNPFVRQLMKIDDMLIKKALSEVKVPKKKIAVRAHQ